MTFEQDDIRDLRTEIEKLECKLKVAKEALVWYRDATAYHCGSERCQDNGEIARKALEGMK